MDDVPYRFFVGGGNEDLVSVFCLLCFWFLRPLTLIESDPHTSQSTAALRSFTGPGPAAGPLRPGPGGVVCL